MNNSYYQSAIDETDNMVERYVNILMFDSAFGLKDEIDKEGFLIPIYRKISKYNTGQKLKNLEDRVLSTFAHSAIHSQRLMEAESLSGYVEILLISHYDLARCQVEDIRRLVTDFIMDNIERHCDSYR